MTSKKLVKKRKRLKLLRVYVTEGLSTTKIQKNLSKEGVGIRRKTLLAEIRSIKGLKVVKEDAEKYIPKKHRKEPTGIGKPLKLKDIFRSSYIIQDLPVHSRPLARNYLGFRLTAFSVDKDKLYKEEKYLKKKLIKLASDYVGYDIYDWESYTLYVGIEPPTRISVLNPLKIESKYFFKVERNGVTQYDSEGDF